MPENRLKVMRTVMGKTQAEVAKIVNITQNTYSYWENGKVKIDNASLAKLAEYYNVSLDFLSGRRYRLTNPVSNWVPTLREDYEKANQYQKQYMEQKYGKVVYSDEPIEENESDESSIQGINELEKMLLLFFRRLSMEQQFEVVKYAHSQAKTDENQTVEQDIFETVGEAFKKNGIKK